MAPDDDVCDKLVSALSYVLGTSIFIGPERPSSAVAPIIPEVAVFVLSTGGPAPVPYCGTGTSFYRAKVQVCVRDALQSFSNGQTMARAVLAALHGATITGYTYCLAGSSEPDYLGLNDSGQPRWGLTFELATEQA